MHARAGLTLVLRAAGQRLDLRARGMELVARTVAAAAAWAGSRWWIAGAAWLLGEGFLISTWARLKTILL